MLCIWGRVSIACLKLYNLENVKNTSTIYLTCFFSYMTSIIYYYIPLLLYHINRMGFVSIVKFLSFIFSSHNTYPY